MAPAPPPPPPPPPDPPETPDDDGLIAGAARLAGRAAAGAASAADATLKTAAAAADATVQAASAAADVTARAAGVAADVTFKTATVAAEATIQSATWTARLLAWLLARMPMRQIIWLGASLVVLLLVLIGLLIWVFGWLWNPSVNLERWREQAQQSLSQTVGRTVTIAQMQVTVGKSPELRVRGLEIANAPGFSAQPLLKVDEAVLRVTGEVSEITSALSDARLVVQQARLNGVSVSLENQPGGNNWTLGPPGRKDRAQRESFLAALPLQALARLVVDEARIDGLQVRLIDVRGRTDTWVLPQAVLTAPSGQPLKFDAQGERCAKGERCMLNASTGALADLARVDSGALADWPLNLMLGWGDRILAFNGALRLRSLHGILSAAAPRIEQDLADAGVRLRGPIRAGIGADLELTAQNLNVRSLTATFGDALLTGQWQADWTLDVDARPALKADLDISGLDDLLESALPPRGAGAGTGVGARPSASGPATSAAPTPPSAQPGAGTTAGLRRLYQSLSDLDIDLRLLHHADAQMRIRMPRFEALGVSASASDATVTLVAGQLWAPMRTTLWGAPFSAEAQIDAAVDVPTAQIELRSRDAQLGPLARGALGVQGLEGRTGSLAVKIATRGPDIAQWMRALDMGLRLDRTEASYGNAGTSTAASTAASTSTSSEAVGAQRPVSMQLSRLSLRWPAFKPLAGDLDAVLLGRPLKATLSGSTLAQFMTAPQAALGLAVRSADLELDLDASIAAPQSAQDDELSVRLRAPKAATLASWMGLDPGARQADAPLALDATLRRSRTAAGLGLSLPRPLVLSLGRTELRVKAQPRVNEGRELLDLDVDVPSLVVADLDALMPRRSAPAGSTNTAGTAARGRPALSLDIPVLPQRIVLADADVALHVGRVIGSPVEVRAFEFKGQVRDGHMQAAPLTLELDRKPVQGAISLDFRTAEPQVGLWLSAQQPDIGHLMRQLGVPLDAQLRFDNISAHLLARASRLGDMLERSSLSASVDGGELRLRDAALGRTRTVELSQGTVAAQPGAPVSMSLRGRVEGQTATLILSSGSLSQLVDTASPIGLSLRADLAAQWVEVSARVARDIRAPRGELNLRAGGPRLDRLNQATGLSLPPWGPWTLQGKLRIAPGLYELDQLSLRVAGSQLDGSASVALPVAGLAGPAGPAGAPRRPTLRATLRSPRLQLDDFPTLGWSALGGPGTAAGASPAISPAISPAVSPTAGPGQTDTIARLREQALRQARAGDALLAAGTLDRYDIELDLALDRVLAGTQTLGGARMGVRLRDGDLRIDPARIDLPGGTANLALSFVRQQAAQGPVQRRAELQVDVPELDYGVIASRLPRKPPAEGAAPDESAPPRGKLSLRVQAQATTPELDELLERGSGQVDLTLWPQDMRSDRFDIWASNLLVSLLPVVDPSAAPHVNCAVLRARLDQGVLRPQTFVLDTTGMRVRGKGSVNLIEQRYALRFEPQAKTAQFFSLATPVDVTGPLNAPRVEVNGGDIAQTVLRLATSLIWVPIQKLAGQKLPADGADVCAGPAARPADGAGR